MPIIGLTDDNSASNTWPRLGKLRKGGVKTPKKPGEDLNHFRFTSDNPQVAAAFDAAFGKTPNSLMVFLPYRNVGENFPTWCEIWNASGLEHRCDGQTMVRWREGDKIISGAKLCTGGHKNDDPRQDAVGRLEVIIPQLLEAGYVGTVTMETHADGNDMPFIFGVLNTVMDARGDLRGVPFRLYRQLENIGVPGYGDRAGQRARADKWLVKIEPAAEWVRAQLAQAQAGAFLTTGEALPEPARLIEPTTGEVLTTAKQLPQPATPKDEGKFFTERGGKRFEVSKINARWLQLLEWKAAIGAEFAPLTDMSPQAMFDAAKGLKETLIVVARNIVGDGDYSSGDALIVAACEAVQAS